MKFQRQRLKGFTLLELIIVSLICFVIGVMVYTASTGDYSYYPEYEAAKNTRTIAEEMKRANDLRERELEKASEELNKK